MPEKIQQVKNFNQYCFSYNQFGEHFFKIIGTSVLYAIPNFILPNFGYFKIRNLAAHVETNKVIVIGLQGVVFDSPQQV